MVSRAMTRTTLSPATKHDIHAVTQAGTTTSPSAATPSPARIEAVTTCRSGVSEEKQKTGSDRNRAARASTSPTICNCGTLRPERPTWVIAWVRASCIAARLPIATAPAQPSRSDERDTGRTRLAARSSAATTLAEAKKARQLAARDQLRVAQAASSCRPCRAVLRQAKRLAAGKPGRNHALITVRCLVHSLTHRLNEQCIRPKSVTSRLKLSAAFGGLFRPSLSRSRTVTGW